MKIVLRQQQGVVAIFLSTILGILLMVTTTYAVRLQVSELSQSSQIDRSEQAYYAAEAGVEDAIRRIQSNPNDSIEKVFNNVGQDGDKAQLIDSTGNWLTGNAFYSATNITRDTGGADYGQLAWRHRKLFDQAAMSGEQVKDETVQFNTNELRRKMPAVPGGVCGAEADDEEVNMSDCPSPYGVFDGTYSFDGLKYCWTPLGNLPPNMEVSVITYRGNDYSDITSKKYMIRSDFAQLPQAAGGDNFSVSQVGGQKCFDYDLADGNHSLRYIFRVKPIFEGAANTTSDASQDAYSVKYTASLREAISGNPLYIDDDSLWVDVIGESGDIRRRILAQIHVSGRLLGIFDFVIYSGDRGDPSTGREAKDLCKAGVDQVEAVYQLDTCTVTYPN